MQLSCATHCSTRWISSRWQGQSSLLLRNTKGKKYTHRWQTKNDRQKLLKMKNELATAYVRCEHGSLICVCDESMIIFCNVNMDINFKLHLAWLRKLTEIWNHGYCSWFTRKLQLVENDLEIYKGKIKSKDSKQKLKLGSTQKTGCGRTGLWLEFWITISTSLGLSLQHWQTDLVYSKSADSVPVA